MILTNEFIQGLDQYIKANYDILKYRWSLYRRNQLHTPIFRNGKN